MEQKSDFDTSLDRDTQIERSALPGKEGSQPMCSQPDTDHRLIEAVENTDITYYGPHPCDLCGTGRIVRGSVGQGFGDLRFDYPEGIVYPNQNWALHRCPVTNADAQSAGTSSKPAAQNTTGYAATVPEVPTCHKCGAFMVKAKPVYDCPECGATTAITECTASPLVMAAQAQQFRFRYAEKQQLRVMRSEFETTCMAAFASSLLAQRDDYVRRLELRLNEVPKLQATLAQQQARLRELEGESANFKTCWFSASDDCKQLETRLREAEQQRDALKQQCEAWAQKSGEQQADAADLRGLLREAAEVMSEAVHSPEVAWYAWVYKLNALRQRIQQALGKTEAK